MMLDDVMLRAMAEGRREEDAGLREYDRAIRFRLRQRRLRAFANVAGTVLVAAALALLAWCCVSDAPHAFNAIFR